MDVHIIKKGLEGFFLSPFTPIYMTRQDMWFGIDLSKRGWKRADRQRTLSIYFESFPWRELSDEDDWLESWRALQQIETPVSILLFV